MGKEKTQFKPGKSGNPGGRPKMPKELKQAKRMSRVQVETLLTQYLQMTREELNKRLKDPAASMIEVVVASIVAKAATSSDHMRLAFLLDRIIGKVKEQVEVTTPKPFIIERLDGVEVIMGVTNLGEPEASLGEAVEKTLELESYSRPK